MNTAAKQSRGVKMKVILIIIGTFVLFFTLAIYRAAKSDEVAIDEFTSKKICKTCAYTKGDYIVYRGTSGTGNYGELIGVPGDQIEIRKGSIFVNGNNISPSTFSSVEPSASIAFKLDNGYYLVLIGDYPRRLKESDLIKGKTKKEFILGKVTNNIVPNILDELKEEKLEEYYDWYKSEPAIFLRNTLNSYSEGERGATLNQQAVRKFEDQEYLYGLESFDKTYYASRFAIINKIEATNEKISFVIIFQDKPDRSFIAEVIKTTDNQLNLAQFFSPKNSDYIKRFSEYYAPLIMDKEHSL